MMPPFVEEGLDCLTKTRDQAQKILLDAGTKVDGVIQTMAWLAHPDQITPIDGRVVASEHVPQDLHPIVPTRSLLLGEVKRVRRATSCGRRDN